MKREVGEARERKRMRMPTWCGPAYLPEKSQTSSLFTRLPYLFTLRFGREGTGNSMVLYTGGLLILIGLLAAPNFNANCVPYPLLLSQTPSLPPK